MGQQATADHQHESGGAYPERKERRDEIHSDTTSDRRTVVGGAYELGQDDEDTHEQDECADPPPQHARAGSRTDEQLKHAAQGGSDHVNVPSPPSTRTSAPVT